MGQACGKNKYVAPLDALEDDGNYEWCNDLDTFMQVVMNQGEVFGIPSESTMEMASRGLLDCPFENDKQKQSWYVFRDKLWKDCSSKKSSDSSSTSTKKNDNNKEDNNFLPFSMVKNIATKYLGHSPYLLMRANQYMVNKYGEDTVYGNNDGLDETASVEEDYEVDVVKSEADLGI